MIQMQPVEGSSQIRAYGWEPWPRRPNEPDEGLLVLTFIDGSTWYYSAVPERVLTNFLLAPSKGVFFHREIKPNYAAMPAPARDMDAIIAQALLPSRSKD